MKREEKYTVVLRNNEGYEVAPRRPAETVKEAKLTAKYMLSDAFAVSGEVTHEPGDHETVEVLNRDDEIVFWEERTW